MCDTKNVIWHHATATRERREKRNVHKSVILCFTWLLGAGKSALALVFSAEDRGENIRRIGEMAKLFLKPGVIALAAFISPFRQDRARDRSLVPHGEFHEIYCHCSQEVCESQDVKGLYKRVGEIQDYTGISSPYAAPDDPELVVDTGTQPLEKCVAQVLDLLKAHVVIA